MLSPLLALTGNSCTWVNPSGFANAASSLPMRSNTARSNPTRSILFTATARYGMPSSEAMYAWRRVCGSTPRRASTRMTAASAVEAPVAMLRVYWMCPGVSATMILPLRRGEVPVRHVDGDALLALGAQAVGEEREVDLLLLGQRRRGRRLEPSREQLGGRGGALLAATRLAVARFTAEI